MSSGKRPLAYLLLGAVTLLVGSCQSPSEVCSPSDPLCGPPPPGPTVASISVTSPIVDSVMAVGRTAQLAAAATDASGNPVSGVTFTWTSTNASTATVNATGLVAALMAGTTTIRASAGSVNGSLGMRAVDADLAGIVSTLGDSFVQALAGGLAATTASTLNGFLSTCSTNVTSGNVLAIDACLTGALNISGIDGTDTALLGVLALFLEDAQRQLQLGG
jgi:uncharacterized protein YjdB